MADPTISSVIMGLVEGITEFLPVSSTGHLILAGEWLGFLRDNKEVADAFEIIIQFGAILALFVAYPGRFARLLDLRQNQGFAGIRGLTMLVVTTIPTGMVGLACRKYIKEHLFNGYTVAIGFAVGAVWILAAEYLLRKPRKEGIDQLSWKDALGIGIFQCCGLWPGMSRSGSTILGGMMLGIDRRTATEYSFFAAIPVLCAATCLELYKSRHILRAEHITIFAIGFVVSFLAAYASVKLFIHYLSRHTLAPFAWYRLAMAAVIFWTRDYFVGE